MTKIKIGHGSTASKDWHADVPCEKEPKVTKHARLIDGVMSYVGIGWKNKGVVYYQTLFDKRYKVEKGTIRPRTKKEQREFELHNNFL